MVCLGIPTLRPLYLRTRGLSIGYADTHTTHAIDPELPEFVMLDRKSHESSSPPTAPQAGHDTRPRTPSFLLRDSGSSHTVVESVPRPQPRVQLERPASAHTRGRSEPDSVDDILGLYDERRSPSRGRNKDMTGTGLGGIWVRNEVSIDREDRDIDWPLRG